MLFERLIENNEGDRGCWTKERLMKSSFTSILLFTAALIKVLLLYSAPSRFAYNALFLPVFPFLTSNSHITSCNQNVTLCLYWIQTFWNFFTMLCYLRLVISTQYMHLTVFLVVNLYFCANCLYYVMIYYTLFFWIDLNSALMKAVSWSSWDVISWRSISLLTLVKNLSS